LAISALLTGFDVSVLLAVLPTIREASKYVPWLATVFAVLVFGLIATLARTWFLTFRDRDLEAISSSQPHQPVERRVS
jgi:heme/copper-type cytochrome/quinol oxidase subunit 4